MYEPKFLRACRTWTRAEAVKMIADGCTVTVAVPDEDHMGFEELQVTIAAGSYITGDSAAWASLPASPRLGSEDMRAYAAVMTAAGDLMDEVNAILLAREPAGA